MLQHNVTLCVRLLDVGFLMPRWKFHLSETLIPFIEKLCNIVHSVVAREMTIYVTPIINKTIDINVVWSCAN